MNYENESFKGGTVSLDGNRFKNCKFIDCVVTYGGGEPPTLEGCDFTGSTRFQFDDAAKNVLAFMAAMYHGGLRPVIDNTFDAIRRNALDK
jgi:hypothetical protein